jgi:hypothetical protein
MSPLTEEQRRRAAAKRKAQGLPPKVEDVATLDFIARLVLASRRAREQRETERRTKRVKK